jgi:nucleoside-diphosphate-sugar epimerase
MNNQHVILGTGPLGLAIMRTLVAQGQPVRMVNRSGKANVPAGITLMAADITNPAQAREAVKGAAVVYFCVNPLYTEWVTMFPPLQKGALDATSEVGAKFIVAENAYMYGDTDGKPMTETLPASAKTRKGAVRAQMSADIMEAHSKGRVRAAIARASDYYGPYVLDSALGDRVFEPMLAGKAAQLTGNIDLLHSFTYIDDIGRTMVTLGEQDSALGQVWHAPNAIGTTQRQMTELAFKQAGLPPKLSTMGMLMMRIGGLFIPVAREMIEMMYEFNKPFVVDSSKIEKAFGLKATPVETGIAETLAWYRARQAAQAATATGAKALPKK